MPSIFEPAAPPDRQDRLDRQDHENRKWLRRLSVVAAVVAIIVLPNILRDGYRAVLRLDTDWRFVEDVVLRDAPGGTHPQVMRWTVAPRIALIDATPADAAAVAVLVAGINEAMAGGGLTVTLTSEIESNIQIFLATPVTFDLLAKNFEAEPYPPVAGFNLIWPDERFDIATAVAVVDGSLGDGERRAATAHQLAHVLGLRGESDAFSGSVVFGGGVLRSTAVGLSAADRGVLRLLYTRLKSGDGWAAVRAAYTDHWNSN